MFSLKSCRSLKEDGNCALVFHWDILSNLSTITVSERFLTMIKCSSDELFAEEAFALVIGALRY